MSQLSRGDVGARISVRVRLDERRFSDVVGDLEAWDADGLAIRGRDGELTRVRETDLVAGRVVGPSLRAAIELQGVSARGWPAPDSEWLGQWWLRAAQGFTARANSLRPLGDPGVPLDEALAIVGSWYAARQLPAKAQVVVGSRLNHELSRRGWRAQPEVSVCTATLERVTGRLHEIGSTTPDVEVSGVPSSAWLGLFRGGNAPPHALRILTGPDIVGFATVHDESGAVAIGRAAVEPPWVGFSAIEVAQPARRRGYARAVLAALTQWARERGASRAYLEVLATNTGAITLYQSLGFAEHHRYVCRQSPGDLPQSARLR